jgi:hypothetical protein
MKLTILTAVCLCATALFAHAQTDTTGRSPLTLPTQTLLGTVSEIALTSGSQGDFCILTGGPTLSANRKVVVIGERECIPRYGSRREVHLELAVNGKRLFTEKQYLTIDSKTNDMPRLDSETPQEYIDRALQASKNLRQQELATAASAVRSLRKSGLAILHAKITDTSEYTQGTNFSISVLNPTEKVIKYITIAVTGLNAVNDPIRDRLKGGPRLTVRAVGPIQAGEFASYNWEYMWHTDLVESFRISEIRVEYMDKSTRVVKDWKSIAIDPVLVSVLEEAD